MSGAAHVGKRGRKIPYRSDKGPHAEGPNSEINVTPLVDVCLVLLIIFMVVTPMLGRVRDVRLPVLIEADAHKEGDQVFVSVDDEGAWIEQDRFILSLERAEIPAPVEPEVHGGVEDGRGIEIEGSPICGDGAGTAIISASTRRTQRKPSRSRNGSAIFLRSLQPRWRD